MIRRIVISHHQSDYLCKFPDGALFVFDDPTDVGISYCIENERQYTVVGKSGNRGHNRNAGLTVLLDTTDLQDDDIIEFFDGDRFPVLYDIDSVCKDMERHSFDAVLYMCMNDERNKRLDIPDGRTAIVGLCTLSNPFYSCGFAMKVSAIRKIMEYNGGTRLFEDSFTHWGCEDQFLGLICGKLGLRVAITRKVVLNGSVGGDSDRHHDYIDSLQEYVNAIMKHQISIKTSEILCELVD